MAWNHRGEYIADPHLTQRSNLRADLDTYRVNKIIQRAKGGATPNQIRSEFGINDLTPLDEREDADDEISFSERDLMPDTNAPVNPAVQTFQESGHGFSVRKGKEGQ
jgi:hypothetical protein